MNATIHWYLLTQQIPGIIRGRSSNSVKEKVGLVRDSNPGPLAPEARIIPLDQRANNSYRQAEIYIPLNHSMSFQLVVKR